MSARALELELKAEIERLRQENAVQNVALIDADDEIKRLRMERDALANWQRNALKEIERLRADLDRTGHAADRWRDMYLNAQDKNERLWDDLGSNQQRW